MESVRLETRASSTYTLVVDDRCDVVRRLSALLKLWDKQQVFEIVSRDQADGYYQGLLNELDNTPWSLLLIDDLNQHFAGPEAMPYILKNLPGGKIAAVMYTVPGSMWLTQKIYLWISNHHQQNHMATAA